MKQLNLVNAIISTITMFVLASFIMGVQLGLDGTHLVVNMADSVRWEWIAAGSVVVFFFQLMRPLIQQGLKKVSGPTLVLPSLDGSTPKQKLVLMLILIAAVVWPFVVSRGTVDIATLTLIYVMLGLGLNVVVGLSGLLVLGYGGFYAIGAYTYALLNHYYGIGFWESLPIAGIVAAAFGLLLGFPVLRLRGDYLAIVTLGFGEIVRILLLNNTEITGGPNGISQIPKPTFFGLEFNRSVRDGGWGSFHEFFGLKYDPSDRIIFLYLVAQHQHLKSGVFAGLLKTPKFRRAEADALERAAVWLERVGLLEFANRQAGNLAYGQQRRLEIARCMVTRPELLMLDEPAAGLNPKETDELNELIADLRRHHQVSVLLIEHDMKLVMDISDRIYVVNQGTPLAQGSPEEVRNNPDVIRAYLGEA